MNIFWRSQKKWGPSSASFCGSFDLLMAAAICFIGSKKGFSPEKKLTSSLAGFDRFFGGYLPKSKDSRWINKIKIRRLKLNYL